MEGTLVVGVERKPAAHERVRHHADRPHVALDSVALVLNDHLSPAVGKHASAGVSEREGVLLCNRVASPCPLALNRRACSPAVGKHASAGVSEREGVLLGNRVASPCPLTLTRRACYSACKFFTVTDGWPKNKPKTSVAATGSPRRTEPIARPTMTSPNGRTQQQTRLPRTCATAIPGTAQLQYCCAILYCNCVALRKAIAAVLCCAVLYLPYNCLYRYVPRVRRKSWSPRRRLTCDRP